jgi:HKD family nuclease
MQTTKINLNELLIDTDGSGDGTLKDNSVSSTEPQFDRVEAIFKNLEPRLVDIIKQFENGAIFGCIAWLTSTPILKALSKCNNVQIIVQKEDFLRPDLDQNKSNKWKSDLRKLYSDLKCKTERHQFREPMGNLSVCADPTVDAVRCVGNHNSVKNSASPRAHHKFLVFCNLDSDGKYFPVALWTGSFNLTKNATYSFENVLYLTEKSGNNIIINAYLNEHHQIFALSEKLDWENEWTTPEFRLGT